MAKAKKSNLHQLEILSALKDKEFFVEETTEIETNEEKKPLTPFNFIDDIRKHKRGDLLDKEQNLSSFDSFITIKGLGMKEDDIFVLNILNKYSGMLDKKTMYNALLTLIPKDSYGFYKWIKSAKEEKSEHLSYIVSYFQCSEKEALEFIEIMGNEWAESIKTKFGDFKI